MGASSGSSSGAGLIAGCEVAVSIVNLLGWFHIAALVARLSQRQSLVRHYYDERAQEIVTDGGAGLAGGAFRGKPGTSAWGGLPDAWVAERCGARSAGIQGAPETP